MSVAPFPNLDEARRKRKTKHTRKTKKRKEKTNIMSQVRKVSWLEMDGREEGKEEKTLCGKGERKSAENKCHALPEGQAMDNKTFSW
jgi:hypothetical protein